MFGADVAIIEHHLPGWTLTLFRLAGVFMLTPVLGQQTIPRQIKALLLVVMTMAVYPSLAASGMPTGHWMANLQEGGMTIPSAAAAIGNELINGMVIGYALLIPIAGMQLAGHMIDQQLGLGLAQIYNPEFNTEAGIGEQFLYLTGLAIFITFGGLEIVFGIVRQSFGVIPLGDSIDPARVGEMAVGLLGLMMQVGVRIAAPLLCLILLETLAMGFVARTMPQLNILSIGFALRILVGGTLVAVTLGSCGDVYTEAMRTVLRTLSGFFACG